MRTIADLDQHIEQTRRARGIRQIHVLTCALDSPMMVSPLRVDSSTTCNHRIPPSPFGLVLAISAPFRPNPAYLYSPFREDDDYTEEMQLL